MKLLTQPKKFLCVPFAMLLGGQAMATDYEDARPQIWVSDPANESVLLPKILSCILENAGVGTDVRLTNADWIALVNEQTCDLMDSEVPTFAHTIISSSRASDSTPQEVVGWMTDSIGSKIVMNATLTQAPTAEDPFGRYTIAFYQANPAGDENIITSEQLDESADPTMFGFAYIYSDDNVDIIVDAVLVDRVLDGIVMQTKAVIVGGNPENIRYAFKMQSEWDGEQYLIGATSASESFRQYLNEDQDVIGAECTSRDNAWQSVHEYSIYDEETGARYSLPYPAITFQTASGEYGNVNSQWFWVDSNVLRELTPTTNEMAISVQSTSEEKTLVWVPATYRTQTEVPYVPRDGDVINYWYWDGTRGTEKEAAFDAERGHFVFDGDQIVPSNRAAYSPQYNMTILIGDAEGDTQSFVGQKDRTEMPSTESTLYFSEGVERTLNNPAQLFCVGWECITSNIGLTAIDLATELSESQNGYSWDFHRQRENQDRNTVFSYLVAPLSEGVAPTYVPGALYYDENTNGQLDPNDRPLIFNFRRDWATQEVYSWDGVRIESLETVLAELDQEYLGFHFDLVSSDCELTDGDEYNSFRACDRIYYNHNAQNGAAHVRNADGTYYAFSDPLVLKLGDGVFNAEQHDRNAGYAASALAADLLPELGIIPAGTWNAVSGRVCNPATWARELADLVGVNDFDPIATLEDGDTTYCVTPLMPEIFDGKSFYLSYDGRSLQGLNGIPNALNDRWYQLVNFNSGVRLQNVADESDVYLVKPTYIDEYLQSLTGLMSPFEGNYQEVAEESCAAEIVFNIANVNDSNARVMLDLIEELPLPQFNATYIKPSTNWADRPELNADQHCVVTDGEAVCPGD